MQGFDINDKNTINCIHFHQQELLELNKGQAPNFTSREARKLRSYGLIELTYDYMNNTWYLTDKCKQILAKIEKESLL